MRVTSSGGGSGCGRHAACKGKTSRGQDSLEHVFRGRARTLVDGLANRLAVVNVETVGETPAEVKYQALVNKLSARLAEVEIDTNNHTLV